METLESVGSEMFMSKQATQATESSALAKLRDQYIMLEDHPIAAVFPLISPADLEQLSADIAKSGLLEEVVLYEGKILDGRNRYRACNMAGVPPLFRQYTGTDPIGFVVSHNIHRRHLDVSQRAMIAASLANMREGRPEKTVDSSTVSQSEAADKLGVSRESVNQATAVKKYGAPELQKAVEDGLVSVSTAQGIARLPHEEQREALAAGRKAVIAKARELKERQWASVSQFALNGETAVSELIAICRDAGGRFEGFLADGETYRVQVEERLAVDG